MTLGDLTASNDLYDKILADGSAVEKLLQSDKTLADLINILIGQVDNKMAETILLLDNYVTVDDEEMSVLEAQLKVTYLGHMLDAAAKLGETEKFSQLIDYCVSLKKAINNAIYGIEVPGED